MYGRHQCTCGRTITNNALGRSGHERGAQCALDSYWRPLAGNGDLWWRIRRGRFSAQDVETAVRGAEYLAHEARRLK